MEVAVCIARMVCFAYHFILIFSEMILLSLMSHRALMVNNYLNKRFC